MRHIEFLGVPGAGKTTALQLMLRMLRLRGATVELLEQGALRALLGARGIVASAWLSRHLPSRLRPAALRLLSGNASDRSEGPDGDASTLGGGCEFSPDPHLAVAGRTPVECFDFCMKHDQQRAQFGIDALEIAHPQARFALPRRRFELSA